MEHEHSRPEITIVVTAHNEAERIGPCLRAIAQQDYPMERVEILVIDDRSSDQTAARASSMGIPNLRVLRIEDPPARLTARQAALDLAFAEARGEIVLVSDADGRVPREWIRELTGYLSFRDGAVTAPVIFAGHPRAIARFQTLDVLLHFALNRWANAHGYKAAVFGSNLAVRREAWQQTGGHAAIGFAASDDFALGQALSSAGWSLRYLTGPHVQNRACRNVTQLVSRMRRRAQHQPPIVRGIISALIVTNVLLILLAAWAGGGWLMLLLLRYLLGLAVISIQVQIHGTTALLKWVWLYEPVATLLWGLAYLSNLVYPRWRWGGLEYDRQGPVGGALDIGAAARS